MTSNYLLIVLTLLCLSGKLASFEIRKEQNVDYRIGPLSLAQAIKSAMVYLGEERSGVELKAALQDIATIATILLQGSGSETTSDSATDNSTVPELNNGDTLETALQLDGKFFLLSTYANALIKAVESEDDTSIKQVILAIKLEVTSIIKQIDALGIDTISYIGPRDVETDATRTRRFMCIGVKTKKKCTGINVVS